MNKQEKEFFNFIDTFKRNFEIQLSKKSCKQIAKLKQELSLINLGKEPLNKEVDKLMKWRGRVLFK